MAVPPDFLIIKKGRMLGLECGRGKEELIANFSALTGIPTIFIDVVIELGLSTHGFGLKCDRCYHPFLLCDEYIRRETSAECKLDELKKDERFCINICGEKAKDCPYAIIKFKPLEAERILNQKRKYYSYYHVTCLQPNIRENIKTKVVPPIPHIVNLEKIEIGF